MCVHVRLFEWINPVDIYTSVRLISSAYSPQRMVFHTLFKFLQRIQLAMGQCVMSVTSLMN